MQHKWALIRNEIHNTWGEPYDLFPMSNGFIDDGTDNWACRVTCIACGVNKVNLLNTVYVYLYL